MKKLFTSVEWMLIIAITIILVIGLVATFQFLFPWLGGGTCIQRQRDNIDAALTAIDDVRLTGEEQIIKFRVMECTKCIWYSHKDEIHSLVVEYKTANETFLTPIPWVGTIDESDSERPECAEDNLVGSKTCTLHIYYTRVEVWC